MSEKDKGGLFGDEDLNSELDAWDKTFDALHEFGEPDPAASAPVPAPAPKLPEPAAPSIEAAAAAATGVIDVDPPTRPKRATARPTPRPTPGPTAKPAPPPARADFPGEPEPTPVPEPIPTARRAKAKTQPPPPPPAHKRSSGSESPFGEAGGDETDFSDLGFTERPEAIGSLLGTAPPPLEPPPDETGEVAAKATPAPPPRPSRPPPPPRAFGGDDAPTKILPLKPLLPSAAIKTGKPAASAPASAEDDSVFTSAARPATPFKIEPAPTDDELFGDLPAQAPQPVATVSSPQTDATRVASLGEVGAALDEGGFSGETHTGAKALASAGGATRIVDPNSGAFAEVRRAAAKDDKPEPRTAAIVRREDVGKGKRKVETDFGHEESSSGGAFSGGESTRVADFAEIEGMAQKQREETAAASAAAAAFFAEGAAPEVSLEADGDFYDDIEIGGSSEGEVEAEVDAGAQAGSRRVTSHVVRRAAAPAVADEDHEMMIVSGEVEDDGDRAKTEAMDRDDGSMSVDDALAELGDGVPAPAAAEEDFSDVAAVVGKGKDKSGPAPSAPPVPPRPAPVRPPVPAAGVRAGSSPLLDDDSEEEPVDWWDDDDEGNELPAMRSGSLPTPPVAAGTTGPVSPALIAAAREHVEREAKLRAQTGKPDSGRPDTARPDTARPDPGQPEVLVTPPAPVAPPPVAVAPPPVAVAPPPPPPPAGPPAGGAFAADSAPTRLGLPPMPRPAPPAVAIPTLPPVASAPASALAPAPPPIAEAPPAPVAAAAPAIPDVAPELPPSRFAEPDLGLDLDHVALPERVDPTAGIDLGEASAQSLLVYERELETIDDTAALAALRAEAGRLSERLGDLDRARAHYEAALLADPRRAQALRGLRRIARANADLNEATRHLDAELAVAGPLERRALALHRVDLLMAAGDQDLARVAVGELLDGASGDVRALLAQLELSFLDGRADEFGESLSRLASALADPQLRAAVEVAHGHLDERSGGDPDRASRAFTAAAESDAGSVGARLGQARISAGRGDLEGYVAARAQLAGSVGVADPIMGAAIALRAAHRATSQPQLELEARALIAAQALAPTDELVLAAVAANATRRGDAAVAGAAWRELAGSAVNPADRAAAAVRAAAAHRAAGDTAGATVLFQIAAELDAEDDHSAAALDRLLAEQGDLAGAAHALARRVGADPGHQRDRVSLARLIASTEPVPPTDDNPSPPHPIDTALGLIAEGRALAPGAPALIDAQADLLAHAGRWRERAELFASVTALDSPDVDAELAALRAALAFDDAAYGAAAGSIPDETARAIAAALGAWTKVLDFDAEAGRAHGAAIALARRLGDRDVYTDVLHRAQGATRHGATATTLALLRARAYASTTPGGPEPDLARADDVLREDGLPADDIRKTTLQVVLAARAGRWGDAAQALEERAELAPAIEAHSLRFRAAQLHLDRGDDAARAAQLLADVAQAHPGFAAANDLLGTARRKDGRARSLTGAPPVRATAGAGGNDAFARLVREADLAAVQGDAPGAVVLYNKALELRVGDPLAADPLARVATAANEPGPVAALALADLKRAEESGDAGAKADAYETLARVDAELRRDSASALMSWEAAAAADPARAYVLRRLERAYAAESRWGDLARLREKQIQALTSLAAGGTAPDLLAADPADVVAMGIDRALLLERDGRPDDELRAAYEDVIARDPRQRLALFHLEAQVRRGGSSVELARLELAIADLYADEPRSRAAFLTRAGETYADLGMIDLAIEKLRAADEARPGYVSALQSWRAAALRGQLWIDVAEAATREADATPDHAADAKAALHHLAGVAYMDKALVGDRAAGALRKALAADPRHKDAFIRLRMLLEEQGDYEDLAHLLDTRVDVEEDLALRTELHRASAELHRNFLGDRDTAKKHYRAILDQDPADLRAIAALSDICWEQGSWAECAETLMNRARLEREPNVLRGIFRRLGTIYADRLPDPQHAIKAFQRVLSYDPEDREALERLADLGIATGEWKMALGACERLVRSEVDPNKKAAHLHRVGRIFSVGFGDRKKAERAYIMALDAAPENDSALSELVRFYQDAGDVTSARVHLNRVAGAMRARVQADPTDGVAYRVIARAMAARESANVRGSLVVARAAAEMARLTGGAEAPEEALAMAAPPMVSLSVLTRPEADDMIFPPTVPPELRQIFTLLGDRIAKHVGVDLRPYGVTRGDRVRRNDSPVAAAAQEIAEQLGLGEIDVYLSQRMPTAMVAEPTSPVSLILGNAIATDGAQVRFAAGAALKLAQSQLAIPARLAPDDLGVMVIALLRLFMPELPYLAVDADAIAAQGQKLRRLIPTGLINELKPYALAMNMAGFDHRALAHGIAGAGWRAGVVTSGGIAAPLRVLATRMQAHDVTAVLAEPAVRELVQFAIGEDYAGLAALS